MVRQIMAILCLFALPMAACGGPADGAPAGWRETRMLVHGAAMTEYRGDGPETSAPQLVVVSFPVPAALADLDALVDSFIAGAALNDVRALPSAPDLPGHRAFHHTGEDGTAFRAEVLAFVDGAEVKLVAFSATEAAFDALGGADFLAERLLGAPSFAAFADRARARAAVLSAPEDGEPLAVGAAGVPFTPADFALCVATVEILGGVRLAPEEIDTLRDGLVAAFEAEGGETWAQNREELRGFLNAYGAFDPVRRVKTAEQVYAQAWLDGRASGEDDALLEALETINPVLAVRGDEVLTARAVDARMASVRLVLEWSGVSGAAAQPRLEAARREIEASFDRLPDLSRTRLATAQSRALRLWTASDAWPDEDKARALRLARSWAGGGGASDAAVAEQLEEQAAKAEFEAIVHSFIRTQGILDGYRISGAIQ